MRLNLVTSLIAATTILTSALPASAQSSESWINTDVLSTDHRAYCDDMVGQNIQSDVGSNSYGSSGSTSSSSQHSHNRNSNRSNQSNRGGGVRVGRIGINRQRSSKNSQANSSSLRNSTNRERTWDRSSENSYDRTTVENVVAGKNCSTFVESAAQVDINREQQETNRMAIDAKERVRTQEIERNTQNNMFNNLMQGW